MTADNDGWRPTCLPCGHEVFDPSQVHYCGYISLDALLSLADPYASDPERHRPSIHPDERQFVVVHQMREIAFAHWFEELRRVVDLLDPASPDLVQAVDLLVHRVNGWVKLATAATAPLHSMRPDDFARFRSRLAPASGMESAAFRRIELLSGIRPDVPFELPVPGGGPPVRATYRDLLDRPPGPTEREFKTRLWISPGFDELAAGHTLASRFAALLAPEGFDAEGLYRWYDDFARPVWLERGEPVPDNDTDLRRLRLKKLADALLRYEEEVRYHRQGHLDLAKKQVEDKPGTGCTAGIPYLRAVVEQSVFFPDLRKVKEARLEIIRAAKAWNG